MADYSLLQRDLQKVWHPCMQMKDFETLPLVPIKSAKGVWLEDFDGNRYIDAISSWWVNLFGHSNDYLNQKLIEQASSFSHIMTANFTHEPMVRLSERLCTLTGLDKVFFGDNGSSAIEVAIKMAFQYHKNSGKTRKKFICFENSYHGETIGALSVGSVGLYKNTFSELLFDVLISKIPADKSEIETNEALASLEKLLSENSDDICAIILEPLVQCAGGMAMHSPIFVKAARELCYTYGVLLILDEIAVGFGRTGTMFAYEQAGIRPDILCLSKGITGGYMPLSVALCTNKIYDAFYDDYASGKAFLHSHSYSGNALSCAVANGVLDIFENDDILARNVRICSKMSDRLEELYKEKKVLNTRQTGMICAIDFDSDERLAPRLFEFGMKRGVFLRPLGNVIYVMPPYVINDEEINLIFDVICEFVNL
jgi:adenosylmethionine-8-amino-7-oxononanoate aminotransferase